MSVNKKTWTDTYPRYLLLYEKGELKEVADKLLGKLSCCTICPRVCKKDRFNTIGDCGVGRYALVSSFGPHFGEEPPLVGRKGSGTVFFAGCNLRCVFCQNYTISQYREGYPLRDEELANVFINIQEMGCENLNLVSPTHIVPQIVSALCIAIGRGFRLPIVYNTGGYDSLATLRLLDGIVDIYMPDMKYSDSNTGERLSGIKNYWEVSKKAICEMYRQVGDFETEDKIAVKGLIIRHLILPNRLAGSLEIIRFIRDNLSTKVYLNIMAQYYPHHRAYQCKELTRRITDGEYREVIEFARKSGFRM